jgi:hypothetical protein
MMKVTLHFFQVKFFLLLVFIVEATVILGQGKTANKSSDKISKENKVKLVAWHSMDCDDTYDPDMLINRITDLEVRNGLTFITVNFSDNCCPIFQPSIEFKENKLFIRPYGDYSNDRCECDCCFSIQFQIEGLPTTDYEVYFKEKKIVRSDDHYQVFEPSFEEYNGQIINKRNRYGFKEGIWITFDNDGKVTTIFDYPENELYQEPLPVSRKIFYPSGSLSYFSRNDTTESWFDDGELKIQSIEYKKGDTTYTYRFRKYPNRNLESKSLEKTYPTIFTSEFDPDYRGAGSIFETVYKEEHFENGQRKYLYGTDTSYSWYESGNIESKRYKDGNVKYGTDGLVTQKIFYWRTPGGTGSPDVENSLYVNFKQNGKISKVEYVRDATNLIRHEYEWEWNDEMKLVTFPKGWKGELPWKKFHELDVKLK